MKLLKINDLFELNLLKFYQKLITGRLPSFFDDFELESMEDIHSHDTRYKTTIPQNIPRTKFALNSVRYKLPALLNNTDIIVTSKLRTHSPKGFSDYAKRHFIQNYSEDCHIPNCYICQS